MSAAPEHRAPEQTAPATTADAILAGLDEEQRQVATSLQGPVCVLAGAGTGKTRAITHRIAHGVQTGVFAPQRTLALTFTARAAAEMRTRLRTLGVPAVQTRTFHAAALRQLQFFWPQAVGGQLPGLLDHKANLIAEAARRLQLTTDRAALRDVAAEIEWAKVSMLTADTYLASAAGRGAPGGFSTTTMTRLFQSYEDVKADRNVIDFEDVLLITVGILQEDARVAATVREQYRHFVVDEYQDVSPLQQRLLDLWLGGREDLCVVGDASQTIYSFTGATSRFLLQFRSRYPDAQVVELIRNYRSTEPVVSLANRLLTARRGGSAGGTWSDPLRLISQPGDGPDPVFTEYPDDEAEAAGVAARIGALIGTGVPASRIAVLFRTNGQSQAFEQALAAASIGYQLRGGERFFARREVREAILQLRAAARADDGARTVAPDPSGTGERGTGSTVAATVKDVLSSLGYRDEAPSQGGAVRERWESLAALVALATELATERAGHGQTFELADLVRELDERAAAQHAPTVDGVTLASLHSAKGLEWDAVFLTGLTEGLMPITFAQEQAEIDEERRLLYVGITRARRHLSLSWSLARSPGGRGHRTASRFLDGLAPAATRSRTAGSGRAAAPRRKPAAVLHCRVCGTVLTSGAERKTGRCSTCPPGYDETVFESLRGWRSETAKEASVPAYVVFTDATLMAIAERMPTSADQLAGITGVGPAKLERYGAAVLAVLAGSGNQPDPDADASPTPAQA
ncbi:ATP-dependent DNA helicase [Tersicoccus phoenicis]|uniref:DNA 3'-5' helicase n=1 Tax=Tersicoccus phoenicis TaxID=554083 RepID=A0A1R1LHP1_9MICC|nr:ATP-dependent DNA helicase UvrD2 [Tersicoccus phoenicis]OMH27022.1 ATP-dependent DNA helicase [Tersicoccus phoenicis]